MLHQIANSSLVARIASRWLGSPTFLGDEIKTRRAGLLNIVFLGIPVFLMLVIAGNLVGGRTPLVLTGVDLGCIALCLVGRYLMCRGRVKLMSVALIAASLLLITGSLAQMGTVRSPTTSLYVSLIVVGGLLFDLKGIVATAALSAIAILGLIVAENMGLLPEPDFSVTITQWITYAAQFGAVAAFMYYGLQSTRRALRRADDELAERRRAEVSLRDAMLRIQRLNQDLESQAEELQTANVNLEEQAEELQVANSNLEQVLVHEQQARGEAEAGKRALEQTKREIQELNRNLQSRAAELEMANKELEAFTYTVSHDLRSPITSIHGFASILLEYHGELLSVQARHITERIRDNSTAMNQLIEGLLGFSRSIRKPLDKETVDVRQLTREVLEDLKSRYEGGTLEITLGDLPFADADPLLIKQVLTNLLSNAFKYTRTRGQVCIEIGSEPCGSQTAYFVRDNGIGFDMGEANKLFIAFQRLDSAGSYEGNGVGLATVQRIIARHGGRVWAQGEVDRGATFFFTLPRASDAASSATG